MVVCQPPFSMPLLSSPSPEKLPKENVLRVGDTSRWSSWSKNGTPILRGLLFPVWWNGIEPFLSRSSLRLLNCEDERWRVRHGAKERLQFASQRVPWSAIKYRKCSKKRRARVTQYHAIEIGEISTIYKSKKNKAKSNIVSGSFCQFGLVQWLSMCVPGSAASASAGKWLRNANSQVQPQTY